MQLEFCHLPFSTKSDRFSESHKHIFKNWTSYLRFNAYQMPLECMNYIRFKSKSFLRLLNYFVSYLFLIRLAVWRWNIFYFSRDEHHVANCKPGLFPTGVVTVTLHEQRNRAIIVGLTMQMQTSVFPEAVQAFLRLFYDYSKTCIWAY